MSNRASQIGLFIGLLVGMGIGLFYTWVVNPVIEVDTAPWQLGDEARDKYMILIGLAYQHDHNFARAEERLDAFNFDKPGVEVARRACDLFGRGGDLPLTLALVDLAHAYGETTCVDIALGPTVAPTRIATLIVPTETPTPTLTPTSTLTPTATAPIDPARITPTIPPSPTPAGPFEVVGVSAFCNPRFSGVLEVHVLVEDGSGLAGVEVQVTWNGGEDRFFTGLQPGEGPGFANFAMEAGQSYRVVLPGRSSPSRAVVAEPCVPRGGGADDEVVLTGYVVKFQRISY